MYVTFLRPPETREPSSQISSSNASTSRVRTVRAQTWRCSWLFCQSPRSSHCPQNQSASWNFYLSISGQLPACDEDGPECSDTSVCHDLSSSPYRGVISSPLPQPNDSSPRSPFVTAQEAASGSGLI